MECVYEYTEGRLCRGVALRLLLLLMAQMDLDVGHGIFNGRHCNQGQMDVHVSVARPSTSTCRPISSLISVRQTPAPR